MDSIPHGVVIIIVFVEWFLCGSYILYFVISSKDLTQVVYDYVNCRVGGMLTCACVLFYFFIFSYIICIACYMCYRRQL